jgi:hypothetical protein
VERCLQTLNELPSLVGEEKKVLFRHMARNYGRTVAPDSRVSLTLTGTLSFWWSVFNILSLCILLVYFVLIFQGVVKYDLEELDY